MAPLGTEQGKANLTPVGRAGEGQGASCVTPGWVLVAVLFVPQVVQLIVVAAIIAREALNAR